MDNLTNPYLIISAPQRQSLISSAISSSPHEICGLLAGNNRQVQRIFPVENNSPAPNRFTMNPSGFISAFFEAERLNLSVLGFYHSHPNAPPTPSQVDRANHHYPEIPLIIIGTAEREWVVKGYWIVEGKSVELEISDPSNQQPI